MVPCYCWRNLQEGKGGKLPESETGWTSRCKPVDARSLEYHVGLDKLPDSGSRTASEIRAGKRKKEKKTCVSDRLTSVLCQTTARLDPLRKYPPLIISFAYDRISTTPLYSTSP
ncbi:hypothetical protein TNCV_3037071 [Trichonephila clavipes]|nr:hypothetical protein TNCV_3037071 [Trichonephila clavipes]